MDTYIYIYIYGYIYIYIYIYVFPCSALSRPVACIDRQQSRPSRISTMQSINTWRRHLCAASVHPAGHRSEPLLRTPLPGPPLEGNSRNTKRTGLGHVCQQQEHCVRSCVYIYILTGHTWLCTGVCMWSSRYVTVGLFSTIRKRSSGHPAGFDGAGGIAPTIFAEGSIHIHIST